MSDVDKRSGRGVAETQRERWIKYGGNVLLVSVIVMVLAGLAIYGAERKPGRLDTTAAGLYSLKEQTLGLIKRNGQKIKIVSLYTKAKPGETVRVENGQTPVDEAGVVSDLLEEYHSKGSNIEVETIDPVTNPGKVDDLIDEVSEKYGGEVKKYRDFANGLSKKFIGIKETAGAEAKKLEALLQAGGESTPRDFVRIAQSLRGIPKELDQTEKLVQRALAQRPPDYKGVSENVSKYMEHESSLMTGISEYFTALKDDKKISEAVQAYIASSGPQYEAIKKQADDLVKQAKGLGELKLDALREALAQKNPILVRGETEWKVLSYDKVWRLDDRDMRGPSAKATPRRRFAGEQMITTAVLALNQPKKLKVAFVRAGGEPAAAPPMMTMTARGPAVTSGQFFSIAERLRDYNYEVVDKDLTNMWAMQSQGQGPPEPSDEEIRDAVWVVLAYPTGQNPQQGGPPPTVGAKLMEHLANGGSALILSEPGGENLSNTLRDWGVQVRTDAVCVHPLIVAAGAETGQIEDAKKFPFIFEVRDWGNHIITNTMHALPGVIVRSSPVVITSVKGVTATPIIPVPGEPSNPKCWGETDQESIRPPVGPTFDPSKDMAAPIFAGAAAEKEKAGRIVVVGAPHFFLGGIVDFLDPELAKRDIEAVRFPGNGELFMNSIFWLSKQEPMIAISPAAMDVSRLDVTPGAQKFWRVGVLLIGLPMLVLVAGAFMYFSRRD